MNRSGLKFALLLSLLLNAGFLGAVSFQIVKSGHVPPVLAGTPATGAADYLGLSPEQRERWRALEADFMRRFEADAKEIGVHREKLIREIFSANPLLERVEAERDTIARLQSEQQRRVIAQLLQEREILNADQRRALAEFLLKQAADPTAVERMHRE